MSRKCITLRQMDGECPRYNVKSTIVPCPDTDYVFLYGGFDENDNLDSNVYLYNVRTNTWEIDSSHPGLFREGHLGTYIGDGMVFVFGGVPYDEVPELTPLANDNSLRKDALMMVYSVKNRQWQSAGLMFLVNAPTRRSRHACCLSEDKRIIYLSGGLVNSSPLNDLYTYDMGTGTWLGPIEFVARFDHLIAVHDGKLYTFGGLDGEMNHVTNHITYMNLETLSVVDVHMKDGPSSSLQRHLQDLFGGKLQEQLGNLESPARHPNSYEYVWLDLGHPSNRLEVTLPLWGSATNSNDVSVTETNLTSFSRVPLIRMGNSAHFSSQNLDIDPDDYTWRHTFVFDGKLYIVGHSGDESDTVATNYLLSCTMMIDLSGLGIGPAKPKSSLLVSDYEQMFLSQKYADFDIITFRTAEDKDASEDDNEEIDYDEALNMNERLSRIKVHRSILLARWPHFRRVIDSGMSEVRSSALFVPEPHLPVWALLFYLYTGTIDFQNKTSQLLSTVDYSVLLLLSNLYELPELRSLVLHELFGRLSSSDFVATPESAESFLATVIRLWENAVTSNEDLFILKIEGIIRDSWPVVTRSQAFIHMPKASIVKLCQECFDRKTPANSPRPKRDSFESEHSPLLPSLLLFREENSNSPFMRSFDDDSASLREHLISHTIPHLQRILFDER